MKVNTYSDFKRLKIIHIFDYYDFPLFFISKSPIGEYFLNYYIDELDGNIDKWLFAKISNKERIDLIQQRISTLGLLNHLFEKKRLYHLFINPLLGEANVNLKSELVKMENFDSESFPEEDFFVTYDFVTKTNLVKVEEDILNSSRFKIVLKDPNNSHDISLDFFLEFLSNFKKSLNGMANDVVNKFIGKDSTHTIDLRVDSLQASSFGVWLRTEQLDADLFEVPEKSLNNLFELIEDISIKNTEQIEEQIEIDESYSLNTIKNVKDLLKDIAENNFTLKLEGTTKSKMHPKEVKFDKDSYTKINVLTKILQKKNENYSETIEIEGLLTSVNTSNNWFRISTTTVGEITGRMSREIIQRLRNDNNLQFRVPSLIKAKVEQKIENDFVEGNYSKKYTLIEFEQPV